MTQINAYVCFNGRCQEAMTYYKDILGGGDLELQVIGESPMASYFSPEMQYGILHSSLTKDGNLLLMGSDMVGPGGFIPGNSVALSISCTSEDQIKHYYASFADSGKILDELKVQFWGDMFAVVEDKFGVRWMFNYPLSKN